MKTIVDGLAIEYKDEGQGPVLLLLHGWQSSLSSFDALTSQLSANYRIVRLDLPGFGGSQAPQHPWHVGEYAQVVASFLKKIGAEPTAIIGHSLGGRIILKGVAEHTLSASKVVLISSAGVAERSTLRNWGFKVIAKAGKAATSIPPFTRLRAKLRGRLYAAAKSDYASAGAMTPTFLNIIGENLAPLAPLVRVPSLLIWGKNDETTPLAEGERLQALMPDAKLEVISGAGHFVQEEKPDEVVKLIREFI